MRFARTTVHVALVAGIVTSGLASAAPHASGTPAGSTGSESEAKEQPAESRPLKSTLLDPLGTGESPDTSTDIEGFCSPALRRLEFGAHGPEARRLTAAHFN